MNVPRRCCRPGCPHYAVATLTFVYSDSTAVVGPLATVSEPHSWDLCVLHAGRITAPRGWELVRHAGSLPAYPDDDDLVALADAVREGEAPVSVPPRVASPGVSVIRPPVRLAVLSWLRPPIGPRPTAAVAGIFACFPTPLTDKALFAETAFQHSSGTSRSPDFPRRNATAVEMGGMRAARGG